MEKLTKDQANEIEQNHNVYVDAESGMYNINGYDEDYGWEPIPAEWIEETEETR